LGHSVLKLHSGSSAVIQKLMIPEQLLLLLCSVALAFSDFVQLACLTSIQATGPGLIIESGVSPAQTNNKFYAGCVSCMASIL